MSTGSGSPGADPLLDVGEAAAHLGVGVRYVRRLVADRRVTVQYVGRHVRIRRSELDRWLSSQERPAASSSVVPRRRSTVRSMSPAPRPGRRTYGTVDKLPSGRWRARYRDPDSGRQRSGGTFSTRGDAERWLASALTDQGRGAWVDPAGGDIQLGDYARQWLSERGLRPTTRDKYDRLLRLHIAPVLGQVPLGRLTPSTVRSWYRTLHGGRPTSADDAYRLLSAVLATAVADELIVRSPCQVRGAGGTRSPERPVASVAEVTAAAEAMPERRRLAVLLAAWCQLRRGELLGLQRGDIDLLHGTLTVERSVTPVDGQVAVGPPKTEAGRRTLTIPSHLLPSVSAHLDRWVGSDPTAWLFAGGGPDAPVSARMLDRDWQSARTVIGRSDLHLHDLRHSGLTWSAATGASTAELMRRGGHASAVVAMRYQHATADRDRALADALAALAVPAAPTALPRRDSGVTQTAVTGGR